MSEFSFTLQVSLLVPITFESFTDQFFYGYEQKAHQRLLESTTLPIFLFGSSKF